MIFEIYLHSWYLVLIMSDKKVLTDSNGLEGLLLLVNAT